MTIIKYYITPAVYCRRAQKIQLWTDTPFKTFLYNVAETLRRRAAFPLSKGNSRKHTVTYSNPLPATLTIYTLSAQLCSPWGLRGLVFFLVLLLSSFLLAGGGSRRQRGGIGSPAAPRFAARGRPADHEPLSRRSKAALRREDAPRTETSPASPGDM